MRYSANLRVSRRYNILKDRFGKSAVVPIFLALVFIVLILIINFAHLSVEQLIGGFLVSLVRTSIAYLIALIFALIIALLVTANQKFENILLPIFDVLQSFPSFALFPVLVQALRNSPEMVIISVLSITMIWPILFSIIGGIKNRRYWRNQKSPRRFRGSSNNFRGDWLQTADSFHPAAFISFNCHRLNCRLGRGLGIYHRRRTFC